MKILYGVQATGNGHLSRAMEIGPELEKWGEVDYLLSGRQGDISLNKPLKYSYYGASFIFGRDGGINKRATLKSLKPIRLLRDVFNLDINQYDLVVNDFEPISAWACIKQPEKLFSISHQAAFNSIASPRPPAKNAVAESIMKWYAPSKNYIGLHFNNYDKTITTPIIRRDIRNLNTSEQDHICVYLPSYSNQSLIDLFTLIPQIKWRIFSKHSAHKNEIRNIEIYPAGHPYWIESLANASGLILGAGFEGPSEALLLGKKLLVVPMKNQYEQLCNAEALRQMGIKTLSQISTDSKTNIINWLYNAPTVQKNYVDQTSTIISKIIDFVKSPITSNVYSLSK